MTKTRPRTDASAVERAAARRAAVRTLPFVLALVVLAGVAAINAASDEVSFFSMMADPVSVTGAHVTTGAVSLLTSGLWATATAAAAVGAVVQWDVDPPMARFLGWSAALSAALFLDDTFLLHEAVLPGLLGIPEEVPLGVYALSFVAIAVVFRRQLVRTDLPLLAVTCLLLGGSIGVDLLQDRVDIPAHVFVEDGLKLLAICGWTGYYTSTAVTTLRTAVHRGSASLTTSES